MSNDTVSQSPDPAGPPGPTLSRWALLVGVNRYVDPIIAPLRFCVNDVLALQRILQDLDYTVVALHDDATEARLQPTKDNVEAELVALCEAAGADDMIWVHFAGHGQLADGRPILMTKQTRMRTLTKSGLLLSDLEQRLKASQARRLALTLDACHSGVDIGRGGAPPDFNRRVHDLAEGFALIAASTAQQKAQEWRDKQHGVFTYYLMQGIRGEADLGGKGFVTVDDLKDYVLNQLRHWNVVNGGLLQEPSARTEGLGDMILADFRSRADRAVETPARLFVDREDELSALRLERLRTVSPFTLIVAPAGYGKSYLLHHLIQTAEADPDLDREWVIRYIDCGAAENPVGHIVRSIFGQSGRTSEVSSVCEYIAQELGSPIAGGRRAVLMILDGVERLTPQATDWLYLLLNELQRRTHLDAREIITVRVIISGRNSEAFWYDFAHRFPKQPAPQRVRLTPFTVRPVRELIWIRAGIAKVDLDDRIVDQLAEEILFISGGHPAVVKGLVDDLSSRSFAIGAIKDYYDGSYKRLVRNILAPLAKSLLVELDPHLRDPVQTLSVFRCLNANTVQALMDADILPPDTKPIALLGDLQGRYWLEGPTIHDPFYRDRAMRRVLAMNLAWGSAKNRVLHTRLNDLALELYSGWIHDLAGSLPDTHFKPAQRILAVVEWLFHALQAPLDLGEIQGTLKSHIRTLALERQPAELANLIADEIARDTELRVLLSRRMEGDGADVVRGWMNGI